MIELDHVIVVVNDLDTAADRLLAQHGLESIAGGRHAGHGTGNRVIPLGPAYLELMAVVDATEAAMSPMGRWAASRASDGLKPAAVCLRTDDIGPIADFLGDTPLAMSRDRPDGTRLSWHLAGLDAMLGPDNLPFFIQWHCEPQDHPGAAPAQHLVKPHGFAEVTIGVPDRLWDMVESVSGLQRVDGTGVQSATIATTDDPIRLG